MSVIVAPIVISTVIIIPVIIPVIIATFAIIIPVIIVTIIATVIAGGRAIVIVIVAALTQFLNCQDAVPVPVKLPEQPVRTSAPELRDQLTITEHAVAVGIHRSETGALCIRAPRGRHRENRRKRHACKETSARARSLRSHVRGPGALKAILEMCHLVLSAQTHCTAAGHTPDRLCSRGQMTPALRKNERQMNAGAKGLHSLARARISQMARGRLVTNRS